MLLRRIRVDHECDVVDMDSACGDVGRNEGVDLAAGESCEVARAHRLREVTVQLDRRNAGLDERGGELARTVLGAREDE